MHRRLGTVLKLYQLLLAKTQQKDKTGTDMAMIEQDEKWERMSEDLLELEVELINTSSVFIDFKYLIECLKAALSWDRQTLDAITKSSDNGTKKELNTEEEKCASMSRDNKSVSWNDKLDLDV